MTLKMPACVPSNFLAAAFAMIWIAVYHAKPLSIRRARRSHFQRRLHADSYSQRLMRHGVTHFADPKTTTETTHEIVAPLASHQISTVADSETKSLDSKFVLHVGPPSK